MRDVKLLSKHELHQWVKTHPLATARQMAALDGPVAAIFTHTRLRMRQADGFARRLVLEQLLLFTASGRRHEVRHA